MQFIRNMFKQYWTIDHVETQIRDVEHNIAYDTDMMVEFSVQYGYTDRHIENLLEQYKQRVRLQYVFEVLKRERRKVNEIYQTKSAK